MKCLNVNDPVVKELLGIVQSEPLLAKLIDEAGDNFSKEGILNNYQLLQRNDITATELLNTNLTAKESKDKYYDFVNSIFQDVKKTTGKFLNRIMIDNETSDVPEIKAFIKTFKSIGYGAMLSNYKTMLLAQDRPLGTEYHEAFHAFEQNIFTDSVRNALYARVEKLTGETLSKEMASERLAEMYRVYALNRKLSDTIKTAEDKSFFTKLFDFLNSFFAEIKNLLEKDVITSAKVGKTSLSQIFSDIYEGKTVTKINNFNETQTKEIFGFMSLQYNKLLSNQVDDLVRYFNDEDYRKSQNTKLLRGTNAKTVQEYIYGSLKDPIKTANGIEIPTVLQSLAESFGDNFDLIEKLSLNFDNLVTQHSALMTGKSEIEIEEEESDESDRNNEFQDITASEINEKLQVKDFLKFNMMGIEKRIGEDYVLGELGLFQPIDFNELHEEVHNITAGATTFNEIMERLSTSDNPNISKGLVNMIDSLRNKSTSPLSKILFENAVFGQYSKQDNNFISHIMDTNGRIEIVDLREQEAIANISGNVKNEFNKLLSNSQGTNPRNKFVNLYETVKQAFTTVNKKYKADSESTVASVKRDALKNRAFSLLAYIGYNLPDDVKLQLSAKDISDINNSFNLFQKYGLIDFTNPDNYTRYKNNGFVANGHVKDISRLLINVLSKKAVFSMQNLDNKRQYSIQQWDFVNKAIDEYNKLVNPVRKIFVQTMTHFKKDRGKAQKINKLGNKDLMTLNIINAKNSLIPYIFSADKSTYMGIRNLVDYSDTVDTVDKLKLYKGIIADELEQYLKFQNNSFGVEPVYFALTQSILPGRIEEFKKVYDSDSLNAQLEVLKNDNSINNEILEYVRTKENSLRETLSSLGINLKNIKTGDSADTSATIEGLVQFFAEGFYKQTKHIVGSLGSYKNGADFLKRAAGGLGAKASLRLDEDYISEYNEAMVNKGTQTFNTDGTFRSAVVDDILSYNLEVAYEFLPVNKQAKGRELINEANKTGILSDEIKKFFKDVPYAFDKDGKGSINVADGQGYVHIDSLRFQLISENKWSYELERFYQKDLNGTLASKEKQEFAKAISVKKPQYYGWQRLDNGDKVMTFYKTSIFPLTRTFAKNNDMIKGMMSMMERQNLNFLFMDSANKVGRKKMNVEGGKKGAELFDNNGNVINLVNEDLVQTTYWKYWGTQVDVDDKIKSKQTIGTQMRKLVFGNLKELLGDEKANQLWDRFNNIENKRIELEKQALEERIYKDGEYGKVIDRQKLLSILEDAVRDRNMSMDYVNEIRNLMTASNGLDLASNRLKIESLLYSLVTNNIIKPKVDGTSQPQITSLGISNIEFSIDDNTIIKQTTQGLEELKFYPITGDKYGMEVYLPNYLKSSVPLGELDSRLLDAIGFRIPTQGHNSIEKIIIKGFLPASQGNAIIVPKEMTLKGGSDFDIDKLNIYLPAFYKDATGKPTYIESYKNDEDSTAQYTEYLKSQRNNVNENFQSIYDEILTLGDSGIILEEDLVGFAKEADLSIMSFKEFKVKQINNGSIELYKDILAEPNLRPTMLRPNSDSNIKNVAKESDISVRKLYGGSNKIAYADILTLDQHVKSKTSFLAGKFTLGSISLHATSHAISQYSDLVLRRANSIVFLDEKNRDINLHVVKDKKGRWINNNIEEYQNASVDVAKDDFIQDINLTLNTGNTHMYLIRAGVPLEQVVYFMSQPILLEYTRIFNAYTSVNNDNQLTAKEAHSSVISFLRSKYGNNPVKFNMSEDNLIAQIRSFKDNQFPNINGTIEDKNAQMYVLEQYDNYYQDANYLFELMNSTAFDTKSVGGNQTENEIKLQSFNRLVEKNNNNKINGISYFDTNYADNQFGNIAGIFKYEIGDKVGNTFLDSMYKVVANTNTYFNNLFKYNGKKYKPVIDVIKSELQFLPNDIKIKMTNRAIDDFITFVIQNMPVTNLNRDYNYYTKQAALEIIELQAGKRELESKIKLTTNRSDKRKLLRELSLNPLYNNVYLDTLNVSNVSGDFVIDYKNGTSFDTLRQEELHRSFDELYKSNPALAMNIVFHNLFQSGLSNSPSQLKNGIPNNYLFEVASNYYNLPNVDLKQFRTLFLLNNYNELFDYHNPNKVSEEDAYFGGGFNKPNYYFIEDKTNDVIVNIGDTGRFRISNNTIKDNGVDINVNGIYRKDYTINKDNNDNPRYNTNSVYNSWFKKTNC